MSPWDLEAVNMSSDLLKRLLESDNTSATAASTGDPVPTAAEPVTRSFITQVIRVHEGQRQQWVERCTMGQPVILIRDLNQPHVPNAIGVWVQTSEGLQQLGYVHEVVEDELALNLDKGCSVAAYVSQIVGVTQETFTGLAIEVKVTSVA